jgi:hypothetical protein
MKLKLLFPLLFLSFFAFSQTTYTIKGSLIDTASATLPFASVFLLNPTDSSLVTYTKADDNGNFLFKNLKKTNYLLKATYVGYLPYQIFVKFNNEPLVEVGKLKLKSIQKDLFEVVVRTAKAPLTIKGDTIEYDARKFKVPPGSTVEDLLRRLPGMQIDAEGNIKSQGKEVKKVLVDGKRFFGDDPKLATKNLPAEAINKVQVYNDASEQSKLTGVDDGKKEKTVNLELKEEFKKGGFGKGTVGAGSDERVMAKFNYNKFDSKNQFAVVGFGNNINQSGLSNNDYQDFKGSQSYNWNDNADFGFSMGGNRFIYFTDDDEGTEVPRSWGPGQGLSKNLAGGVNYNYDTKKTKVSTNYFYNNSVQNLNQIIRSQNFLPTTNYFINDSTLNQNISTNHRMSFRFEKQIDSLNTLLLNVNSKIGIRDLMSENYTSYSNKNNEKFRNQDLGNEYLNNNMTLASSLIYRHKFKKKGRNFALSGTFNKNKNNQDAKPKSKIEQLKVNGENFLLGATNLNIVQNIDAVTNSDELKSSVLYIEPLSKKLFLEAFFNTSKLNQIVDRNVFDIFDPNNKSRIDSLSRYFDNNIGSNRLGSSLRFNNKGINLSVGLAAQRIFINGAFYGAKGQTSIATIKNPYDAFVPNVSLNVELKNNKYVNMGYSKGFNAPKIKDLQPFKDNTNPLVIREGNPDLKPTTSHELEAGFGLYNPVSFVNLWSNVTYTYYQNQVIYNQQVSEGLRTILRPENITGGQNVGYYFNFGFPIKKTKIAASIDSYSNFGKNPQYINNVLNTSITNNFNLGLRFDLTPVDWFTMFFNVGAGSGGAKYSEFSSQNQKFTNNTASANLILQMPKLVFFTADFKYNQYKNIGLNFDQKIPILNLSTYKVIGKAKKSEIRLSLYDAFKRNLGVNQSAFQNVVSKTVTQTLSRYFMVSYTYNMRGISAKVKKSRWE